MSMKTTIKRGINGAAIRIYRQARGYTQGKLAEITGVPRPNISAFETGDRRPSTQTLEKIAKALKVKTDLLLE